MDFSSFDWASHEQRLGLPSVEIPRFKVLNDATEEAWKLRVGLSPSFLRSSLPSFAMMNTSFV